MARRGFRNGVYEKLMAALREQRSDAQIEKLALSKKHERFKMKRNVVLTSMSVLSILLLSLHLTDDIVYGSDKSAALNIVAAAVLVIWLYGTLVLAERRSGYTIMLLGSVVGIAVFTVHVSRSGGLSAGTLAQSSGAFFFVWTLLALVVSSALSAILSVQGLWSLRRSKAPSAAINSQI